MNNDIMNVIVSTLSRDLLLDLTDMGIARARQAFEIIRDNTSLKGKHARGAEGQIRYRIMEQGFQDICENYGGLFLDGGLVQGANLKVFQPFMRFGPTREPGIVLGLASMPSRGEIPTKNMSRTAGVSLNYKITPRLALDECDPQPGDIFILFLVARDPAKAGKVDEIAIGLIDSEYKTYLFYETMEEFMARYNTSPEPFIPEKPLVRLKPNRGSFRPPENPPEGDEGTGGVG